MLRTCHRHFADPRGRSRVLRYRPLDRPQHLLLQEGVKFIDEVRNGGLARAHYDGITVSRSPKGLRTQRNDPKPARTAEEGKMSRGMNLSGESARNCTIGADFESKLLAPRPRLIFSNLHLRSIAPDFETRIWPGLLRARLIKFHKRIRDL